MKKAGKEASRKGETEKRRKYTNTNFIVPPRLKRARRRKRRLKQIMPLRRG